MPVYVYYFLLLFLHGQLLNIFLISMELTKQDKKHIKERVKRLQWRVVDEAAEYARLYEKTFYEEVIKMCQERIEIIDLYHEQVTKVANKE